MLKILEVIKKYESGNDYSVVYGGGKIPLTKMTIGDVLDMQDGLEKAGVASTAAGAYQIINDTLSDLIKLDQFDRGMMFNQETQDDLALALLQRRGFLEFLQGNQNISETVENLSKEWASLPKDSGGQSYYAGDGLNKAHATYDEVIQALIYDRDNQQEDEDMANEEIEKVKAQASEPVKSGNTTSEYVLNIVVTILAAIGFGLMAVAENFGLSISPETIIGGIVMLGGMAMKYTHDRTGLKIEDAKLKAELVRIINKE